MLSLLVDTCARHSVVFKMYLFNFVCVNMITFSSMSADKLLPLLNVEPRCFSQNVTHEVDICSVQEFFSVCVCII